MRFSDIGYFYNINRNHPRIYILYKFKKVDGISELEISNDYWNIGIPEKQYNLIIEKVGSKELLAKITAKIRQLEELKKI